MIRVRQSNNPVTDDDSHYIPRGCPAVSTGSNAGWQIDGIMLHLPPGSVKEPPYPAASSFEWTWTFLHHHAVATTNPIRKEKAGTRFSNILN
jgi:hypothetical protein